MKHYDKSIRTLAHIRAGYSSERVGSKKILNYIDALDDALECMELCNPIKAHFNGAYIECPRCKRTYTAKNSQEITHGSRRCQCGQALEW